MTTIRAIIEHVEAWTGHPLRTSRSSRSGVASHPETPLTIPEIQCGDPYYVFPPKEYTGWEKLLNITRFNPRVYNPKQTI